MTVAVFVCGALGALLFLLGINVTRLRTRTGPGTGQFPTDPADPLLKAIRAHGNAAEYVPTLMILSILAAQRDAPRWAAAAMIAALAARVVHATALLSAPSLARNTALRTLGAAGTYAAGIALAIAVLVTL